MEQQEATVEAWVTSGKKKKLLITVKYASKYSLWVRFPPNNAQKDGAEFASLGVRLDGQEYELGSCRLISEPNIDGYAGRLVLTRDFYDLESLFFHRKATRLPAPSQIIPPMLEQGSRIRQPFKNYVADLAYALSLYRSQFDALNTGFQGEPEHVSRIVEQTILESEGRSFMRFLDEKLAELKNLVSRLAKKEGEEHSYYFRKLLWNVILCSPIMTRTNLKPRGYAGDYEMMRMLYANAYEGDSIFSKLLHKHPVEQPAAEAVRNRREYIAKWVHQYLRRTAQSSSKKKVHILSVACGPAFELKNILEPAKLCHKLHFTLFDQDPYALLEAAKMVDHLERSLGIKISVEYLRESVRTMLFTKQLVERWGQCHLIYSMGLFDYLTLPMAVAVLGKLYQLLVPGGQMVIGNFHPGNPNKLYMEYWLDWLLYYRTEQELKDLTKDLPGVGVSVSADSTGIQLFLHVNKR
jgi:extracellular factor (EF) 3-hydroxypalmitic acid methyl ester biosynthesis protein